MSFTYTDTLTTDLDRVRFHIGDTVNDSGPRPSDGNFTDEEITGLVTLEGTWQRSVAACFERLAAEWQRYPTFKADGLSLNRSDIAKGYAEQAKIWRLKYGGTAGTTVGYKAIVKVDGYSDDVDNLEMDE